MFFIRFIFVLFLVPSFVYAVPSDYPPSFFQLAQIHHYALNKDLIAFKMSTARDRVGVESRLYEVKRDYEIDLIKEVEAYVATLIKNPLHATSEEWEKALDHILSSIENTQKEAIIMCFEEKGCREVILKAILAEQKAMKEGKLILWRALKKALVAEKESDDFLSFSHGLFSGFIFDGYFYHCCEYSNFHACTYIYLSSFLRCKRRMKEGVVETKIGCVTLRPKGGRSLALYGVTMTTEQLEKIRNESIGCYDKKEIQERRGNFMKPHHAVYGRGELFHPKVVFPVEAELIKLFSTTSS